MPDENELNNLPHEEEAPPPAAPPEDQPPVEETTQPPEQPAEVDETPDPASMQARIEELREQRKKAEEDALYWRKQKAEARADYFRDRERPPDAPREAPPEIGPEPKPGDFEDYDEYVKSITDYRVKAARAEWDRDAKRRDEETHRNERMQNLHLKLQEGMTRYDDFEDIVFDRTAVHITPMVVDILSECEAPADVAYYLAKNRVEGVAISRMTPIRAAREIARIEAKLTTQPTPPPQKTITKAPTPINPVNSGASGAGMTKDPNKMTVKEYNAWRESQGARRY